MIVRREKRSRKMRGSKTHGYGSKKKHRGSGSRGGKGHAGSHKHKIHHYIKYEPGHFGKKGFRSINQRFGRKPKVINVSDIQKMESDVVDLRDYTKVLGRGEITRPVKVIARSISESARQKIESAGGKVILRS